MKPFETYLAEKHYGEYYQHIGCWLLQEISTYASLCVEEALKETVEQRDTLAKLLGELYAQVRGECPSLLNEDSGGDAELDYDITKAISIFQSNQQQPKQ